MTTKTKKTPVKIKSIRFSQTIRDDISNEMLVKDIEKLEKYVRRYKNMSDKAHKALLSNIPKTFKDWVNQCPYKLSDIFSNSTVTMKIRRYDVLHEYWEDLRKLDGVIQDHTWHRSIKDYDGDFTITVPYTILHKDTYYYREDSLDRLTLDDFKGLKEHLKKCSEMRKEINEKRQDIFKILNAVTTTKQLFEVWPEGYKYYKKYCTVSVEQTKELVPVSSISRVNDMFNLP